MLREWAAKFWLKFLYSLAHTLEIRPFLQIDPNAYCPACGDRNPKKLRAVPLEKPDSGSKVGVLISCGVCSFAWVESSVTVIEKHAFEVELSEEESNIREMQNDKRTKIVRTMAPRVGAV